MMMARDKSPLLVGWYLIVLLPCVWLNFLEYEYPPASGDNSQDRGGHVHKSWLMHLQLPCRVQSDKGCAESCRSMRCDYLHAAGILINTLYSCPKIAPCELRHKAKVSGCFEGDVKSMQEVWFSVAVGQWGEEAGTGRRKSLLLVTAILFSLAKAY